MPPVKIDLDAQISGLVSALKIDVEAGLIDSANLETIRDAFSRLFNHTIDKKAFYLELTIIEQALKSCHANYRSTQAFKRALKSLLAGTLVTLLLMVLVPELPFLAYLSIPILYGLEGYINHHRHRQRYWQNVWQSIEQGILEEKAQTLLTDEHYLSQAYVCFVETPLFNQNLLLPLSQFREEILALHSDNRLRLSALLNIHHTVNDIADALKNNEPTKALAALDSLQTTLNRELHVELRATKVFFLAAIFISVSVLALSLMTGGVGAAAALIVSMLCLTGFCLGSGLLCDGLDFSLQRRSVVKKVDGLRHGVNQVMPFFAKRDGAVFPLVSDVADNKEDERPGAAYLQA